MSTNRFSPALVWLVLFFVLVLGAGRFGIGYYNAVRRQQEAAATDQIAAIAKLKADSVTAWRRELVINGSSMRAAIQSIPAVIRELKDPAGQNPLSQTKSLLLSLSKSYGFGAIGLTDAKGKLLILYSHEEPRLRQHMERLAKEVPDQDEVSLTDFHQDEGSPNIHLGLNFPITDPGGNRIAAIVIRIDPEARLYPMLQAWPTRSESGEAFLARADKSGFSVFYPLRAQTAYRLTPEELPVLTAEARLFTRTLDGTPVVGIANRIPDSPWLVVAKVNRSEIEDQLRWQFVYLCTISSLLILAVCAGFAYFQRDRASRQYRERYEQEVRRREQMGSYHYLSQYANDPILLLDDGGHIVEANERAGNAYGYGREQLLRMNIRDLRAPSTRTSFQQDWNQQITNNTPKFETIHMRSDGAEFPVEVSSKTISIGGRVYRQSIIRDISEWKKMEQSLAAKERRYRVLFDSITDAVFVNLVLPDGTTTPFIEVNKVACTKLGCSREELLAMKPVDIISKGSAQHLPEILPKLRKDGKVLWEGIAVAKDGKLIPMELRHRLFELDGQLAVLTAVQDITDRKRSEELFREGMERYQHVVQNAPLGILILLGEMVQYANPAALRLLHAPTEAAVVGRPLEERIVLNERRMGIAAIKQVCEAVRMEFSAEQNWVRLDNQPITVSVSAVPYSLGEKNGALIFFSDLTEMRQAQAEREAIHAQFLQAQKMESVGRLAGGVAHDFNNLLTVINGHSELSLARMIPTDPSREAIAQVLKAGQQAAQLTRQLLAFSRKQVFETKPIDINHTVLDMRQMLQRMVGDDVEIEVRLNATEPVIMADSAQLQQVVMNLAVNARDSMHGGGRMTIESSNKTIGAVQPAGRIEVTPGNYVVLSVRDTGTGMDEATRENIFEPFFTTKKAGKGTGLGLSTVYGIVRRSGGWIDVSSQLGEGSRFDIYWPQRAGLPASSKSQEPQTRPQADKPFTILIVEDGDSVRATVVAIVKNYGYQVLEAESGATALKLAASHPEPIDLVLSDVQMPNMTGPEMVEKLKSIRPDIRVLYMSGHAESLVSGKALQKSSYAYIQKPFSPDDLAMRIKKLLATKSTGGRILIVDDEDSVRQLFQAVLEGAGHQVQSAQDGREALKRLHEQQFDLVLMDLVMPGTDGIEAIIAIRNEFPKQKIIAVSGAFNGVLLKPAQMMGAATTLLKPVSPEVLERTVKTVLAS